MRMQCTCAALIAMFHPVVLAGTVRRVDQRRNLLRAEGQPQLELGRVQIALTKEYSFYHTTEELAAEARRLAQGCRGALTVQAESHGNVSIDVAYLSAPPKDGKQNRSRFSMITGEHARELIGPETALHLMKMLCGEVPADGVDVDAILDRTDFQVIFNANPVSRRDVERGDYCIRSNPNGVDLNRNWDERFSEGDGGKAPFSEPETIISRKLLSSFKPDIFMSIHSGTLGLYMPWAFSSDEADPTRNKDSMMNLLQQLDGTYCQCPYGAAAKNVGYNCPGTSLDWVYDHLNASYSFAFEIWVEAVEAQSLRAEWKKLHAAASMLGISSQTLSHAHYRDFFEQHSSDFVHHDGTSFLDVGRDRADQQSELCMRFFNPVNQEDFDAALTNWGLAYLRAAEFAGR